MQNVVLVGFPGCGKTTMGEKLAAVLHLQSVDLDAAIEKKYHLTIPQLFEKYGEFVFRQYEYETLLELLAHDGLLIATGGGAPCYRDAMDQINRRALSLYLRLPESVLVQRLAQDGQSRPLLQGMSESQLERYVHETLSIRAAYYERAYLVVDADRVDVQSLAEKIITFL